MNTHRFLSLLAAALITVGQAIVFATDTSASSEALAAPVANLTQPLGDA
jgi:hypothetical protein